MPSKIKPFLPDKSSIEQLLKYFKIKAKKVKPSGVRGTDIGRPNKPKTPKSGDRRQKPTTITNPPFRVDQKEILKMRKDQ